MTVQHATSVIVLGDGRYRATCSCHQHWRSQADRRVAEIQAEQHVEYHREAARIRGEQP